MPELKRSPLAAQQGGRSAILRALAIFWGAAFLLIGVGAAALQLLGPPDGKNKPATVAPAAPVGDAPAPPAPAQPAPLPASPEPAKVEPAKPEPTKAEGEKPAPEKPAPEKTAPEKPAPEKPAPEKTAVAAPQAVAPAPIMPPRAPGSPVPAPDPDLQEPAPSYLGATLPRIGPGSRMAMRAYAAGFDPADTRPRVGVLVSGLGMSEQESEEAIRAMPAAISLAFSPYAQHPERMVALARARGHETLLSVPMEPQNYPINDAGNYALLARAPPAVNAARLEWTMSRFAGYVGATGALGRMSGERFAASDQMPTLLEELGARGLLYVDARPDAAPPPPTNAPNAAPRRAVDLVIDEPPVRVEIETKLAQLEQLARDRGSAIGLAGGTTPVTTERLAAWAATLSQRGLVLTPVSALVLRAARSREPCCRIGRMSAPCCSIAPAGCSSPAAPICRMPRARQAAGNCRKGGSTRMRTRVARCCANWPRRSAPIAPRSSPSTRTG